MIIKKSLRHILAIIKRIIIHEAYKICDKIDLFISIEKKVKTVTNTHQINHKILSM